MSRSQVCFVLLFFVLLACVSWAQTPLTFISTGPCRLMDTRSGNPGTMAGGTTMVVNIPQDPSCEIPNTALAYALNITAVPTGPMGYVTVWPDGMTQPNISTLNAYDGRIKAVGTIVGAGNNNAIDIFASDATDIVMDISGYFVAPGNRDALYYYPLRNVCELVNTVNPPSNNGLGGPALQNGVGRSFQVNNNPNCTIPADATAYALNVIATPVNGASLGYLTVWDSALAQPSTSLLNATTGTAVANAAIVPAVTGAISLYAYGADTNVEVDMVGYFGPKTLQGQRGFGDPDGDALYMITPCRGLDTRPYPFQNRMDYIFQAQGGCISTLPTRQINPSIDAFLLNATVLPEAGLGYFPIWRFGEQMPLPSTIVDLDGSVTSNMAIVAAGAHGEISAYASAPTNLLYDLNGYFASAKLTILTLVSQMPPATYNVPYGPVTVQARGGVPPYSWSATLPANLTIASSDPTDATISGCAVNNDSGVSATIKVKDATSRTYTEYGSLTINTLPALGITTTSLPPGTLNNYYSEQLTATGGYGTYAWSIVAGSLPPGFSLNPTTGVISGFDPNQRGGWYAFTVQVADQECPTAGLYTQNLSIRIN